MKKIIVLVFSSASVFISCGISNEDKSKIKQQEDSIAMADAMSLDLEAKVAQHMLDSAEAAFKADSLKNAELKKATH